MLIHWADGVHEPVIALDGLRWAWQWPNDLGVQSVPALLVSALPPQQALRKRSVVVFA